MTHSEKPVMTFPWADAPQPGELREISQDVFWLRVPLPWVLDHVNVYLLRDGRDWVLVDTGLDTKKTRALWEQVLDALDGDVTRVIVTHHHPDHIGLAGWLQSKGAVLLTTRTAWLTARMLTLDVQERPPTETISFWRSAGMAPALLQERIDSRPVNLSDVIAPLPLGFTRIQQSDVIAIGARKWRVEIGHGHAPEHATLWEVDGSLVLAGDQILGAISPNLSLYPTEPLADPIREWVESCQRLRDLAGAQHLVMPGHKLPFSGLAARLSQLIDNHDSALDRLREHLRVPHSAAECFYPLYRRDIGAGEYGLALGEAFAHCQHLWHNGDVQRDMDAQGVWRYQIL